MKQEHKAVKLNYNIQTKMCCLLASSMFPFEYNQTFIYKLISKLCLIYFSSSCVLLFIIYKLLTLMLVEIILNMASLY